MPPVLRSGTFDNLLLLAGDVLQPIKQEDSDLPSLGSRRSFVDCNGLGQHPEKLSSRQAMGTDIHLESLKERAAELVGGPAPMALKARVKRCDKTQKELDQQTERIKKRRRESAQRSRARKNQYIALLEEENKVLRLESLRLRQALGANPPQVQLRHVLQFPPVPPSLPDLFEDEDGEFDSDQAFCF